MRVSGKAAHSGLDFEKGQSAIAELAKQIVAIQKLYVNVAQDDATKDCAHRVGVAGHHHDADSGLQ